MSEREVRDIPAEKAIRTNNLLLGVLISVMLGFGGYLSVSVDDIREKMTGIFSSTQVNDARIGGLERRVDRLEDKVPR